jgi:hypothetical protein
MERIEDGSLFLTVTYNVTYNRGLVGIFDRVTQLYYYFLKRG